MANIQDRITSISNFFKGMQVKQIDETSVIYVVVNFPQNWIIDETIQEKFDVSVINGEEQNDLYFCADMSVGFDKVFDAIDYCIRVNKDAMERAKIFQDKLRQLKELFSNEEIGVDELRGVEFVLGKKKKPAQRKKTPIDEIADKEMNKEGEV